MSKFEFDPWVENGSSMRCATSDKRFLVLVDVIEPYQRTDGQAVWNLRVVATGKDLIGIGTPLSFPRGGVHAIVAEEMKGLATFYAAQFIGEYITDELRKGDES